MMSEINAMPDICTILADGTIINANCGHDGENSIWIWIREADDPDNNMSAMFSYFSDPEKTRTITSHIRSIETVFDGYTQITALQLDYKGCVHVQMKRGVTDGK